GGPPALSGMDFVGIADEPDPVSGQFCGWFGAKSTRAPAPAPGQRASVSTEELRISFGANDLPEVAWWIARTRYEDLTDADQPPAVMKQVRWSRWRVDNPVDEGRFRIP
ncbi:MAG: hypothetical protein ACKO5K_12130, partial [Armatimonadota bacterium]